MIYYVKVFGEKTGERIRLWTCRRINEGRITTAGKLNLRKNSSVTVKKNG